MKDEQRGKADFSPKHTRQVANAHWSSRVCLPQKGRKSIGKGGKKEPSLLLGRMQTGLASMGNSMGSV